MLFSTSGCSMIAYRAIRLVLYERGVFGDIFNGVFGFPANCIPFLEDLCGFCKKGIK